MIEKEELIYYIDFLKTGLRSKDNEYLITSIRSLQSMLKVDQYRREFVQADGIACIMSLLNENAGFQLQYQLIFCLWCLSFNSLIAIQIQNAGIVLRLCDILSECSKQKIDDQAIVREAALMMHCCQVPLLELGNAEKMEDPDLQDDVDFLNSKLLSSLKMSALLMSTVQRLIKILIGILGMSGDPLILSVAAHDLGEYVRFYPSGKEIVQQLQGKDVLMELLEEQDPNVRYHALLAIQKLMVQNWGCAGIGKRGDKTAETQISLEIGCGSGVVTTFLHQILSQECSSNGQESSSSQIFSFCTDLNQKALKCSKRTAALNAIDSARLDFVKCDLFEPFIRRLSGLVDILIFNPPYVPSDQEPGQSTEDFYFAGGKDGRQVIDRVLPKVAEFLSPQGCFYMVALEQNKVPEIIQSCAPSLTGNVVLQRRCGIEQLYVMKFCRNAKPEL
uniref:Methyltransferase HEMK2 n=1 Tax=Ditylenchus dipsaci TaxID=166011 RepID=A0A915DUR1_9BILA